MCKRHLIRFMATLAAIGALSIVSGCDGDSTSTGSPELVLRTPSNPVPANGASDISTSTTLYWAKCNPTDTSVRYSVYFFGQDDWFLLADSLIDTTCSLPTLRTETVYQWRVAALDSSGARVESPIWAFSTADDWTYPLSDGNRWEYRVTLTYSNFDPDSLAFRDWEPVDQNRYVRIEGTRIEVDSSESFRLMEGNVGMIGYIENYFQNRNDGMYCYGSMIGGIMPYKIPADQTTTFDGLQFPPATGQFLLLSSDIGEYPVATGSNSSTSRKSLEYPLKVGSQWTYAAEDDSDLGYRIDKKVIARTTVEVLAGSFDCFCVKWLRDLDGDGEWDDDVETYDYVSEQGLIRREGIVRNVILRDYTGDGWQILGTADYTIDYVLTDYDLNTL